MVERHKHWFVKRMRRAVPRGSASYSTLLLFLFLLASTVLISGWGGHPGRGGGGWRWVWPPWGNIPYMEIRAVEQDATVTIEAYRFPEGTELTATMGLMGTRGVNGIEVGTVTATGESFVETFTIPQELAGEYRIAIRLESGDTHPYYAFNWFYNNTTDPYP